MSNRAVIWLDEDTRKAAGELALYRGCSISEAIRRAVLRDREDALPTPDAQQKQRTQTLRRLFELFEGHDAGAETRQLKEQDECSL